MPLWLENGKKSGFNFSSGIPFVDVRNLNRNQNLADKIVENHFRNNLPSPLLMMITGQGSSSKSFVINNLRQVLHICCIVSSYFGITTLNIDGITLHLLLKLPKRGKTCCELKGKTLADLQLKFRGVKSLIIDEYLVIGQNMFG